MLKGFGARFKKARGEQNEQPEPKPMDFGESYRIRGKMIGVLLRDARLKAGRSLEDCSRLLRTTPNVIESWEFGDDIPSLPQLEQQLAQRLARKPRGQMPELARTKQAK